MNRMNFPRCGLTSLLVVLSFLMAPGAFAAWVHTVAAQYESDTAPGWRFHANIPMIEDLNGNHNEGWLGLGQGDVNYAYSLDSGNWSEVYNDLYNRFPSQYTNPADNVGGGGTSSTLADYAVSILESLGATTAATLTLALVPWLGFLIFVLVHKASNKTN